MSIVVTSTTSNKPEAASTAIGELAESKEVVETKESASAKADETAEKSEHSEEGKEELEAKKTDDEGLDEEAERPKKKGGFQKRIDKLTRKNSDLERELEYLKREVHGRTPVKDEAPAKATENAPKEDDFNTHADYLKALARHEVQEEISRAEAKKRELDMKTEFQSRVENYAKKEESFKAKHEDYEDVMDDVSDVALSVTVRDVILSSENGPELAYELAKNRDELERICKLPAIQAAVEIGLFKASLNKSAPEVKKTKAPRPIEPVGKSAATASKKTIFDAASLSQAEYEAIRNEERKKRNSAWG